MITHQGFLSEIESYLSSTGMSAAAFGRLALKDPNFVTDVRNGRSPSISVIERCASFMRANPLNLERPHNH